MSNDICKMFGIEVPIFAFTHSPDVVIEVSNAGGMGILGASGMKPKDFEAAMEKISNACPDKSYGVDLILPNNYVGKDSGGLPLEELERKIPKEHRQFIDTLLKEHGIDEISQDLKDTHTSQAGSSLTLNGARELVEIAFNYPIKFLVNALGIFPEEFKERAKEKGIKIGALVGQVKHAIKQKEAGCDIIIAQGYEAGGHTGDIATMALVPQVVDAVYPTPVLCAGGVASGRQLAAALALGAQGAWTGSIWLVSKEAETHPVVKQKFFAASSADTIRSKSSTGKPARQLISAWTEAWEDPNNPNPLPMPLHGMLVQPAKKQIEKEAADGHEGATKLLNYFVSQTVGMYNEEKPAKQLLEEMVEDCVMVLESLPSLSKISVE